MCPAPMIRRSEADIVATLGRDARPCAAKRWACSHASPGCRSPVSTRSGARRWRWSCGHKAGAAVATLTRVVLQCYYRDDRVVRSLGLEPRPPYPRGYVLDDGDWSLLGPVRARPPFWRQSLGAAGRGAPMQIQFDGRTVVVSGAGHGFRAVRCRDLRPGLGARVFGLRSVRRRTGRDGGGRRITTRRLLTSPTAPRRRAGSRRSSRQPAAPSMCW